MARLIDTVKCVVFDLDDTLYPERDYCKSGFEAASELIEQRFAVKGDDVSAVMWQLFNDGTRGSIFNDVIEKFKIDCGDEFIGELVECYRNHRPQISLPPESRQVLDELSGKVSLALLTDGFMPAQRLKVQSLGIENYFWKIVYTELLGRENWKPSTAGFELIMKDSVFLPQQYVYVADNPKKDFIAPNKLGWKSVFVNNGTSVHLPVAEIVEKGEFEISKLSELMYI